MTQNPKTGNDQLTHGIQFDPHHSKISPTAKLVAFFRTFSDIPYANEIAKIIGAKELTENIIPDTKTLSEILPFAAPAIEARYKGMLTAIKSTGIKQILELASGLSFRGAIMTIDPSIIYIETDLQDLTEEKKKIITKIPQLKEASKRNNYQQEVVNALTMTDIQHATRHFDPSQPIAIVHEGLYMYLSRQEKQQLAENIQQILHNFGGVWITPDFMLESETARLFEDPRAAEIMTNMINNITSLTARDLSQDQFRDNADLSRFLESTGFKATRRPQIDGSFTLSSLNQLTMSENIFITLQQALGIWIIELNPVQADNR
jgi:O-methyltransferase involved in polyketide biosynthesis